MMAQTEAVHGSRGGKSGRRNFEPEQYETLNGLLAEIAQGRKDSINEFLEIIWPWAETHAMRLGKKYLGIGAMAQDTAYDVMLDRIHGCVRNVQKGGHIKRWSDFQMHFLTRLDAELKRQAKKASGIQQDNAFNVPAQAYDSGHEKLWRNDMASLVENLPGRLREVIAYRYYEGLTSRETAPHFAVSRVRIDQLEVKVLNMLRYHFSAHSQLKEALSCPEDTIPSADILEVQIRRLKRHLQDMLQGAGVLNSLRFDVPEFYTFTDTSSLREQDIFEHTRRRHYIFKRLEGYAEREAARRGISPSQDHSLYKDIKQAVNALCLLNSKLLMRRLHDRAAQADPGAATLG